MGVLALDLGTKTGFALGRDGTVVSGVQDFSPGRFDSSAMRFKRFDDWLDEMLATGVDHIVYEEVRRHRGTDAAHIYGGFHSHLMVKGERGSIPIEGYAVGSIKRAWTGKGNASKDEMIAAAIKRGFDPVDDNEADALAMLHMASGWGMLV